MVILKKGITKNGVDIQIEDWSKDYPKTFAYGTTIVLYPTAKRSVMNGVFEYPKMNERFRLSFDAKDNYEANEIFKNLVSGEKQIFDYKNRIKQDKKIEAIF